MQRVFGGIEQDTAGTAHRKAPQTGDAGSDGNGQIDETLFFETCGVPTASETKAVIRRRR
jgi:hypothetical protein